MKSGKTIFAICALGLALPGTALAATPTATTGSDKNITATTATLTGTVDPTDNAGNFSFTVNPTINTRYQVRARTNPQVTSPVTQATVAYAISMKTKGKRVSHGKRVRFSGVVLPPHDGATVLIEKRGKGGV